LISIATQSKETEYCFYVEPNHEQLNEISRLIDAGELRSVADQMFPLEQTKQAYETRAKRGKRVITVKPS